MKNIIVKVWWISLVISLMGAESMGSTAFEVKGSLQAVEISGGHAIEILTDYGQMKIDQVNAKFRECSNGKYLVVDNYFPADTYTLLDIIDCEEGNKFKRNQVNENIACPKIYSPVCGQPLMPECSPNSFCAQVMPDLVTYGNICEMKKAGAKLVHREECGSNIIR